MRKATRERLQAGHKEAVRLMLNQLKKDHKNPMKVDTNKVQSAVDILELSVKSSQPISPEKFSMLTTNFNSAYHDTERYDARAIKDNFTNPMFRQQIELMRYMLNPKKMQALNKQATAQSDQWVFDRFNTVYDLHYGEDQENQSIDHRPALKQILQTVDHNLFDMDASDLKRYFRNHPEVESLLQNLFRQFPGEFSSLVLPEFMSYNSKLGYLSGELNKVSELLQSQPYQISSDEIRPYMDNLYNSFSAPNQENVDPNAQDFENNNNMWLRYTLRAHLDWYHSDAFHDIHDGPQGVEKMVLTEAISALEMAYEKLYGVKYLEEIQYDAQSHEELSRSLSDLGYSSEDFDEEQMMGPPEGQAPEPPRQIDQERSRSPSAPVVPRSAGGRRNLVPPAEPAPSPPVRNTPSIVLDLAQPEGARQPAVPKGKLAQFCGEHEGWSQQKSEGPIHSPSKIITTPSQTQLRYDPRADGFTLSVQKTDDPVEAIKEMVELTQGIKPERSVVVIRGGTATQRAQTFVECVNKGIVVDQWAQNDAVFDEIDDAQLKEKVTQAMGINADMQHNIESISSSQPRGR